MTMLNSCAPGHTAKNRSRNLWIRYEGRRYELSLGKPGEKDPEHRLSEVRHMVAQLELNHDCVKEHFPELKLKPLPQDKNP